MMEKLQPKLRFPEFDELWKINILGNLFDITAGGDIKKQFVNDKQTNEFKYPIYANAEKNKGLYGFSSIYKINEEVVTIAGRGVNIGIAHARKEKFYPIVRLLVLKPKFQFSVDFFEYVINNLNIVEESTGVPQLTAPQISKYRVNYPSLPEQQKIASFLTTVDDKISNLKQKVSLLEEYKKGVMQQIFSQQIRFKDTSAGLSTSNGNDYPEWEEKSLGEVCEFYSGGTPLTTNKNFYNGHIPFIKSGEIGEKETKQFITELGLKNSSAKLVSKGDILYALYGATSGEVSISQINGAINQAVLCIKSSQNQVYLFQYLKYQKDNIVSTYIQGGQGNLSANIIKELNVALPSINEQTKIAEFLSGIDEKIETTKLQLSKMEVWKKGLLQGMFC